MALFLTAVGVALALEGLLYALVPGQMKALLAQMLQASDEQLRFAGLVVAAGGVVLAWIVRGFLA